MTVTTTIATTQPDAAHKTHKTSSLFIAFLMTALFFTVSFIAFAPPLPHASTQERLKASKDSFTNKQKRRQVVPNDSPTMAQQDKSQGSVQSAAAAAAAVAVENNKPRPDYHVVFSTSCTAQQNWESYVLFYHAMKVKQPGNVTRIASACTAKEAKEQTDFFNKYIHPMNPGSFHLHLTPDYGKVSLAHGHYYKYMNKRES